MQRRSWGAGGAPGAVAGAAAGLARTAPAADGPVLNWRLVSTFPKSLDALYGGAEEFARLVGVMTGGRFKIQTFAAGEIVPGLQSFDAVSNGTVECCQSPSYYYVGKSPAFAFASALPFGLNYRLQNAWLLQAGGLALNNEFFKKFNTTAVLAGNTGAQMGGWFRSELKSVKDLEGLKFRIAGYAGKVMERLGAVPQQIAGGEIYPALEKGTIDAAEWVGPYDDEKLGFYKIARYYYYPGFWEAGPSLFIYFNLDRWNELPESYQTICTAAAAQAMTGMMAKYDVLNPMALRRLVAAGVQLRPFPADLMEAAYRAAQKLYVETAAADADFRTMWESWQAYRNDGYLWWQVAELTDDAFMVRSRNLGQSRS